jgi:hypothetical protein
MAFGTLTPAGLTQVLSEPVTGSELTTFDAMNLFMGRLTHSFMNRGGSAGDYLVSGHIPGVPKSTRMTHSRRPAVIECIIDASDRVSCPKADGLSLRRLRG